MRKSRDEASSRLFFVMAAAVRLKHVGLKDGQVKIGQALNGKVKHGQVTFPDKALIEHPN